MWKSSQEEKYPREINALVPVLRDQTQEKEALLVKPEGAYDSSGVCVWWWMGGHTEMQDP